jgi:hypothetical protein
MGITSFKDLTGLKFNMLLVVSQAKNQGKHTAWNCVCDCGVLKIIDGRRLKEGTNKSCGCISKISTFKKIHGLIHTKEYRAWSGMKKRCTSYPTYIEKNIKVCDNWLHSFETFFADMGVCPEGKSSIDRINNNKGYYKENCRWADTKEQNNNYSQNRMVTFNSETMNVTQWADKLKISRHRIYQGLNKGWNMGKILDRSTIV